MCMRDGAMDVDVQQFYVKLYAIKSTSVGFTEEVQVGLYQYLLFPLLYLHSFSSLPSALPSFGPPFPSPSKIFDGDRYHAGKSRIKKEKTEIVAIPFVDGMSSIYLQIFTSVFAF